MKIICGVQGERSKQHVGQPPIIGGHTEVLGQRRHFVLLFCYPVGRMGTIANRPDSGHIGPLLPNTLTTRRHSGLVDASLKADATVLITRRAGDMPAITDSGRLRGRLQSLFAGLKFLGAKNVPYTLLNSSQPNQR